MYAVDVYFIFQEYFWLNVCYNVFNNATLKSVFSFIYSSMGVVHREPHKRYHCYISMIHDWSSQATLHPIASVAESMLADVAVPVDKSGLMGVASVGSQRHPWEQSLKTTENHGVARVHQKNHGVPHVMEKVKCPLTCAAPNKSPNGTDC